MTVYQPQHAIEHAMGVSGTLEDWQQKVGRYCAGNSRLILATAAAFAAPLLHPLGEDSGGFHFRGASSTGKTTMLNVAGSVWGGGQRGYNRSWRATSNGIEAIAAAHNDALLNLDEMGQVDPREVGEIAYQLANGAGKHRANRHGAAKLAYTWRLLFLSTGEISLADHMLTAGKRQRGGQEVRLVDITAEAGAGMGVFENIHGAPSSDAFARMLKEAATRYYGAPIRAYLERLTEELYRDRSAVLHFISEYREMFASFVSLEGASGEVYRVAGRFSLVAAAGELAIDYGILPLNVGDALSAAMTCFEAWRSNYRGGTTPSDIEAAIAQVRAFIEQHGASRFAPFDSPNDLRVVNRAGFVRAENGMPQEYHFFPEVFRQEVCKGYDARAALLELQRRGLLLAGNDGKPSAVVRPRASGPLKVYRIASSILE